VVHNIGHSLFSSSSVGNLVICGAVRVEPNFSRVVFVQFVVVLIMNNFRCRKGSKNPFAAGKFH